MGDPGTGSVLTSSLPVPPETGLGPWTWGTRELRRDEGQVPDHRMGRATWRERPQMAQSRIGRYFPGPRFSGGVEKQGAM